MPTLHVVACKLSAAQAGKKHGRLGRGGGMAVHGWVGGRSLSQRLLNTCAHYMRPQCRHFFLFWLVGVPKKKGREEGFGVRKSHTKARNTGGMHISTLEQG